MSGKSEARLTKHLAKQLKQRQKTVRLAAAPDDHSVRSEYAKLEMKGPRQGANPGSIMQMSMSWTVDVADRDGNWSWGVNRDWGDSAWCTELLPKLQAFAKLNWAEIEQQAYGNEGKRHRSHHTMETADICVEAQGRLEEIGQHSDTVFRFRLGNLPRLWGIRKVAEFQVLWYDPTHGIYPVN